jgi:hypothetical protein
MMNYLIEALRWIGFIELHHLVNCTIAPTLCFGTILNKKRKNDYARGKNTTNTTLQHSNITTFGKIKVKEFNKFVMTCLMVINYYYIYNYYNNYIYNNNQNRVSYHCKCCNVWMLYFATSAVNTGEVRDFAILYAPRGAHFVHPFVLIRGSNESLPPLLLDSCSWYLNQVWDYILSVNMGLLHIRRILAVRSSLPKWEGAVLHCLCVWPYVSYGHTQNDSTKSELLDFWTFGLLDFWVHPSIVFI